MTIKLSVIFERAGKCTLGRLYTGQTVFSQTNSGRLSGLYQLELLTKSVDNLAAIVPFVCTAPGIFVRLFLDSAKGHELFPNITMPDMFLTNVAANVLVFIQGYIVSILFKHINKKDFSNLTIYTTVETADAQSQ